MGKGDGQLLDDGSIEGTLEGEDDGCKLTDGDSLAIKTEQQLERQLQSWCCRMIVLDPK